MSKLTERWTHVLPDRRGLEYFAVGTLLVATTLLLHGSALLGFWRWDDGAHLYFALSYTPWDYFLVPEVTRAQSGANVTPWNALFYDINLALFGVSATGHYAHLLFLVAANAFLLYMVLRVWLRWPSALAGALAFLLGMPTVHIAQGLMHGHYASGLIFSLLAVLAWVQHMRCGGRGWLALAAVAYMLATTCKEVYVPLPGVLLFLPIGSVRQRLRALWPFAMAGMLYIGWRYTVLDHLLGGYAPAGNGFDALSALRQVAGTPRLMFGEGHTGTFGILLFGAAFFVAAWRRRIQWGLSAAMLALILLPLLPLTIAPGIHATDRYLFVPWTALAVILAVLWPRERRDYLGVIFGVGLLWVIAVAHYREQRLLLPDIAHQDALSRFVWSLDTQRQGLFVGPDSGYLPIVLTFLRSAREIYENGTSTNSLVVFPASSAAYPLIAGNARWKGKTFYEYVNGTMQPMTSAAIQTIVQKLAADVQTGTTRELEVHLAYDANLLRWRFGPYSGKYLFNVNGASFRLNQDDRIHWPADRPLRATVCFESADAWVTCSPELEFSPNMGKLDWARRGTVS